MISTKDRVSVIIKAYIYDNLTCQGTPESIIENMDYLQEVLYDLCSELKEGYQSRNRWIFSFNPLVE